MSSLIKLTFLTIFFFLIGKKQKYYKAKIKKGIQERRIRIIHRKYTKRNPKGKQTRQWTKPLPEGPAAHRIEQNKKKDLPSLQPGQKIYQRIRLFDTMSIGQCPHITQEETFCPLIRSYLIFKNQQVPILTFLTIVTSK